MFHYVSTNSARHEDQHRTHRGTSLTVDEPLIVDVMVEPKELVVVRTPPTTLVPLVPLVPLVLPPEVVLFPDEPAAPVELDPPEVELPPATPVAVALDDDVMLVVVMVDPAELVVVMTMPPTTTPPEPGATEAEDEPPVNVEVKVLPAESVPVVTTTVAVPDAAVAVVVDTEPELALDRAAVRSQSVLHSWQLMGQGAHRRRGSSRKLSLWHHQRASKIRRDSRGSHPGTLCWCRDRRR